MVYLSDKFGFVKGFVKAEDYEGEQALKAVHCIDVREALPFKTRGEAYAAYKLTRSATWWHVALSTDKEKWS